MLAFRSSHKSKACRYRLALRGAWGIPADEEKGLLYLQEAAAAALDGMQTDGVFNVDRPAKPSAPSGADAVLVAALYELANAVRLYNTSLETC